MLEHNHVSCIRGRCRFKGVKCRETRQLELWHKRNIIHLMQKSWELLTIPPQQNTSLKTIIAPKNGVWKTTVLFGSLRSWRKLTRIPANLSKETPCKPQKPSDPIRSLCVLELCWKMLLGDKQQCATPVAKNTTGRMGPHLGYVVC